MDYYEDQKNVQDYIKMCEGLNGGKLIEKLSDYLAQNSSVLELGMGPGTDLKILNKTYLATGSDNSQAFLDRYLQAQPSADLLPLDAVTMNTDRKFDCIFSNKVLHHLDKHQLKQSISKQLNALEENGIVLHTFWKGDKEETLHGMRFVYYNGKHLEQLFGQDYQILELSAYAELEEDDSIYIIARKLK